MSSMNVNRKDRRPALRLAGGGGLPSLEGVLTSIAVIAAFALLACILLGAIG
jgi:hypothetical protein